MKKIFVVLLFALSINFVTGCGSKNKKEEINKDNEIKEEVNEKINISIEDNYMYINDKKIDLYKEISNDLSEEEFYNDIEYKYELLDDILYIEVNSNTYNDSFFVDKEGNIIEKLSNMELSLSFDNDDINMLVSFDVSKVEGNSIYLKVKRVYESAACTDVLNEEEDAIYSTVDKITYLGNNKFKIEKKVSDTITSADYVNQNGGLDACIDNPNMK